MINIIKKLFAKSETNRLQVTKSGAAADRSLQLAIAMLLLDMSGRDEDYAPEEVGTILRTLVAEFESGKEAMLEIINDADRERKKKENVNQGVRLLNDSYNDSQKITIISLLWKVLIADGKVDKSESRYLEQIKNRLHLTEAQIEAGKLQARKSPVG